MMKNVKDLKTENFVNLDEAPKEEELPEERETNRGRPAKSNREEVNFSLKVDKENFYLFRALCSIKGTSMKETLNEAIEEILAKPENAEAMQEARRLEKAIRKFKK